MEDHLACPGQREATGISGQSTEVWASKHSLPGSLTTGSKLKLCVCLTLLQNYLAELME